MHTGTRVLSLFGIALLLLVFLQPTVAASPPSDPSNVNYAATGNGGMASAATWESGFGPALAIDENAGTTWRATTDDALVVDFNGAKDLFEVHIHLADYAMPAVDLYRENADGTYAPLTSWSGNTATTLIHDIPGGVIAYGVKVAFPAPLHHTHSYNHPHQGCVDMHIHTSPFGEFPHCHEYGTTNHAHYADEDHYAHVSEVEAWGLLPGEADDGLSDAFETSWWYRQTASASGLPVAIPNNGTDVLILQVERPTWSGVNTAAFLDLEVDHVAVGDLAVAVGFWDGAAWDDRLVWVPGSYANGSVWDTTEVVHVHENLVCVDMHVHEGPMGEELHCHEYEVQQSNHLHPYAPVAAPTTAGNGLALDVTDSQTASASSASGSVSQVTIDLRKATLQTWEQDAGFRTPQFAVADLQGRTAWRVLIRDWYPYSGSGSVLVATLVTEEQSDIASADTDGDGLLDGDDVALGAFPVAADTDWDGLGDFQEKDPWSLTLTVDGTTTTAEVTTSPAAWDSDGDGLSDGEEAGLGFDLAVTDPTITDTDGDGTFSDGEESLTHFTNATLTDSDGDGLSDVAEVQDWGTLPYAADSDDDGLSDYVEVTTLRSLTFSFPHIVLTQCGLNACTAEGAVRQGWFTDSGTYALPPTWHVEDVYAGTNVVDHYWAYQGSSGLRYLLSPALQLASALTPSVSFDYSLAGTGSADVVVVTANGYEVATPLGTTGGAWQAYELDLTPWQGALEHVGFAASSSDPGFAFLVDSITIRGKTDPWVADTDGDGLEDGPEVDTWGSRPLTNDTDWDGIEDTLDPRLNADDFPPVVREVHSQDFRTGVTLVLAETNGILRWEAVLYMQLGMQWCTPGPNCFNEIAFSVEERTSNLFDLTFDWSSIPDQPEYLDSVVIRAYDARGLEMEIEYTLELDAAGHATPDYQAFMLGFVAHETGDVWLGETVALSERVALTVLRVYNFAILSFLFVLLCCATMSQGGSPSGSQTESVGIDSDATPLTTYPTAIGTVNLFAGFTATAGGHQRGFGWDHIAALHPAATYQLLADILAYGTYVTEGIWTTVTWVTTVNGVETMYRLLLKDLVVISLEVAEVIVDITGTEIIFDEEYYQEHTSGRAAEKPGTVATVAEVTAALREQNRDRVEIWKGTGGRTFMKMMFVHQAAPGSPITLVFVAPRLAHPWYVITAFKAGTDTPWGGYDPNPGIKKQWLAVYSKCSNLEEYSLHVIGDIKDPTKVYDVTSPCYPRLTLPYWYTTS